MQALQIGSSVLAPWMLHAQVPAVLHSCAVSMMAMGTTAIVSRVTQLRMTSSTARGGRTSWLGSSKPFSELTLAQHRRPWDWVPNVATSTAAAQALHAQHAVKMVRLMINGRSVEVPEGASVLEAARKAGVYVPALCYHPNLEPAGTCRLCLVDILRNNPSRGKKVASCATPAAEGMVVLTNTPELKDHVRSQIAMQRYRHPDRCQTCAANGQCEFQDLVGRYDVPPPPFVKPRVKPSLEKDGRAHANDRTSPALDLDFEMCVLCLRCVRACSELQGMDILGVVARGNEEVVAPVYNLDMKETECISCGACVASCPVAAITEKDALQDVQDLLENNIDYARLEEQELVPPQEEVSQSTKNTVSAGPVQFGEDDALEKKLNDLRKYVSVVQTAPAVRITISEAFGLPPGATTPGQLVTVLKMLGFDYVFDTNFTADLTILEEGNELLQRIANGGPFPMFTSCCPGWINMVEKVYPDLIPHVSSCKSPQQMFGSIAKSYFAQKIGRHPSEVKVVSIMPCVAKKDEASRENFRTEAGGRDVDYVLTTRELARLIKMHRPKISFQTLPDSKYDSPLGKSSGAALLFGTTGGVMEAALRTAYAVTAPPGGGSMPRLNFEEVRGLNGIREATVDLHGTALQVAIAHQGSNLRELVDKIRAGTAPPYHFVEMMACRGGCIGGAGNPKDAVDTELLQKRFAAVYKGDADLPLRTSHENSEILQLYDDFLGKPLGHKSHELLHTHYTARNPKQAQLRRQQQQQNEPT
ncbi:NADP-reducing hydrogenase subunit HndC [Porphyridium purpureum]|uniref:NADP-reducing hydrogenase subunit HndC n=1 Tax=Porphyridium purpureum TaxID=35688 RepID=A0A5J4Z479_PORPP|nr:NADP-reducing hydrogenase subunit HndC [Porphyridium purpureum]|eukprot:POR8614..scf295_1